MSGIRALKKISSESRELNKFQENVGEVLTPVLNSAIINGLLLKQIELLSGTITLVEHKLGREPLGWLVVRKRANAQIWDSQDTNTFKARSLALECSANVTIDLWVF